MTPHTTVPLLWDGDRFRPITDLPDLAEWGHESQDHPFGLRRELDERITHALEYYS